MTAVPERGAFQRFAWDGVSCDVPVDWHLSAYSFGRDGTAVELQDDVALRLQLNWMRPSRALQAEAIRRRYEKLTAEITESAARDRPIVGLPPGWNARRYDMPDGRRLAIAFFLAPEPGRFFCLARLHFDAGSNDEPEGVVRRLAGSLCEHTGPLRPWAFYDVAFELGREFQLVNTALLAGRKLLVFEWRLRRLFVWFFSLAHVMLRQRPAAECVAEFLNGFKPIRGPRFAPDGAGGVLARRRRIRYPLGHYEEIGRQCFRYRVEFRHEVERDRLVLCVYQHRNTRDLAALEGSLEGWWPAS